MYNFNIRRFRACFKQFPLEIKTANAFDGRLHKVTVADIDNDSEHKYMFAIFILDISQGLLKDINITNKLKSDYQSLIQDLSVSKL